MKIVSVWECIGLSILSAFWLRGKPYKIFVWDRFWSLSSVFLWFFSKTSALQTYRGESSPWANLTLVQFGRVPSWKAPHFETPKYSTFFWGEATRRSHRVWQSGWPTRSCRSGREKCWRLWWFFHGNSRSGRLGRCLWPWLPVGWCRQLNRGSLPFCKYYKAVNLNLLGAIYNSETAYKK